MPWLSIHYSSWGLATLKLFFILSPSLGTPPHTFHEFRLDEYIENSLEDSQKRKLIVISSLINMVPHAYMEES